MSDVDAIAAVKRGDKDRYAELVERYQGMVYGIAWSRLGDAELCEEAAQETFIRAFRYLMALRHPERFAGWLARIARTVSISLLRKRRRELDKRRRWMLESAPVEQAPTPVNDGESLAETLRRTLESMPAPHRECLVLFYMEGKDVRGAAEILGISEAAMRTRLHRARQALRTRLEAELEASLSDLRPRQGFSAAVLPLLPAIPMGAGVGGAAVTSGTAAAAFKSLPVSLTFFFAQFAIPLVLASTYLGWLGKLESDNLRAGPSREFRRRIIESNVVAIVVATVLVMAASSLIILNWGPQVLFQALLPYGLWGGWVTVRRLRICPSPYYWGVLVSFVVFTSVYVAVGFLNAPVWVFFIMMLPLNLVLYRTNESRPLRHDYNLFLRRMKGILAEPQAVPCAGAPHTEVAARAFARFLGERFLIEDYRLKNDRMILFPPAVRPGVELYLRFTTWNSRLVLNKDGSCEAQLGSRDLRDLRKLMRGKPEDPANLEADVAETLEYAFRAFVHGRTEEAEALLEGESEESIFLLPTRKSREHRIRGRMAIAASALLLLFPLYLGFQDEATWLFNKPLTLASASHAVGEWSGEYTASGTATSDSFLHQDLFLPVGVLEKNDAAACREAVLLYLERLGDSEPLRIELAIMIPDVLFGALDAGYLSDSDLSELGFRPERVRAALSPELIKEWNTVIPVEGPDGSESHRYVDLENIAYRVALLKKVDCLDLVDGETLARDVALLQITPADASPNPILEIDLERAVGLFYVDPLDFKKTHAALWILETLGRLDLIDREACVDGIMSFYNGDGEFVSDGGEKGIYVLGQSEDAYFALESLRILRAAYRIHDLKRWDFRPRIPRWPRERKPLPQDVTAWAYQTELERIRSGEE